MTGLPPISSLIMAGLAVFVPIMFGLLGTKSVVRLAFGRPIGRAEKLSIVGAIFFASLFGWGHIEANLVERVDVQIDVPGDVDITVALIGDLHLTQIGYREEKVIEIVNSAGVVALLVAGDTLNGPANSAVAKRFFSRIAVPVLLVRGNTDPEPYIFNDMENVTLLDGETHELNSSTSGSMIVVHGSPFGYPPEKNVTGKVGIWLQHSPDMLEDAVAASYAVTLNSHTHAGQITFFGLPVITMSATGHWKGLYRSGQTVQYVSNGVGLEPLPAPQMRLFAPPTVEVITLR